MTAQRNPFIFCALDTAELDKAVLWAKQIGPITGGLKLGMEFVNAFGPQGIEAVQKAAPDAALFIDLKFHDIPNTVAGAVRAVCARFAPAYLNVHAVGGREMMQAAKEACSANTKLLAVTVLTSMDDEQLEKTGQKIPSIEQVKRLANLASECGLHGVVCSALELEALRYTYDEAFILMVPGIRPAGSDHDDQKRIMTPHEALQKGADFLVIGRPITQAPDRAKAAQAIAASLLI